MNSVVPIIVGPTAVGKTALSLHLARKTDTEIVSADSRQIYRYMDIGTAKVSSEIRKSIVHHMIDICDPDEYFSAGKFAAYSREIIAEILQRQKCPLVVGGSGFYISALIDGIFEGRTRDPQIRRQLDQRLNDKGLNALFSELQQLDPEYAHKISRNDQQRILRSLEVYYVTGKQFSQWHQQEAPKATFTPRFFGLNTQRPLLNQRINHRVDAMIDEGLIEEVKSLIKLGYGLKDNALNTVGYKEVFSFLEKKITQEEMTEQIKRNTRRFAKRQMTWFRRDQRIEWFSVNEREDIPVIGDRIAQSLNLNT